MDDGIVVGEAWQIDSVFKLFPKSGQNVTEPQGQSTVEVAA